MWVSYCFKNIFILHDEMNTDILYPNHGINKLQQANGSSPDVFRNAFSQAQLCDLRGKWSLFKFFHQLNTFSYFQTIWVLTYTAKTSGNSYIIFKSNNIVHMSALNQLFT